MSTVTVVVEGRADAEFMQNILAEEIKSKHADVKAASGRSAADAMARTILSFGRRAVVLVVDAETTNESRVGELRDWLQESQGMMAPRDRFLVALMVPEFEVAFFEDIDGLEKAIGRQILPEERIRSKYEPKQVLRSLLGPRPTLTPELVMHLRKNKQIEAIREFIRRQTSAKSNAA